MFKVVAGVIIGAGIGFGANHLCALTGGACPLMSNKIVSVALWAMIGGMIGFSVAFK